MTALPLDLVRVSSGFAVLTTPARRVGQRALSAAAEGLSKAFGQPVRISGCAQPARGPAGAGTLQLGFECGAVGAGGCLEVDVRLATRAVDVLAGGTGDSPGALTLTPIETAATELLTLIALDSAVNVQEVAALGLRVVRDAVAADPEALCVELDIEIGTVRGRARVRVPAAAVRALARGADLPGTASATGALEGRLSRGTATLRGDEIAALEPGDVVLLDDSAARDALLFPGGVVLTGHREGDQLAVEEVGMSEWTGAFPIALSVEIARVSVPVADLARLEPGGVLPLHVGKEGHVVLRAGERAFARGQLVEVGGAIGVRVDEIEARP